MLSLFTDVSDVMSYHVGECDCWAFLTSRSDVSVGHAFLTSRSDVSAGKSIMMSRSDISPKEDLHDG